MAQVFGEKSKYLIRMDWINRIGIFFMWLVLFFLFYGFISVNFGKSATVTKVVIAAILYIPFVVIIKTYINKYFREHKSFYHGRKGEYAIYYELLKLSEQYLFFQDIKLLERRENIDFVVVGPTGIFTIEVKSNGGKIDYSGEKLTINGKEIEKNFLGQAMGETLNLKDYLLENGIKNIFIEPVLVFSNKYASVHFGFKKIKNVYVIQKGFLKDLILNNRDYLSYENIDSIKNVLIQLVGNK
jgi:hypothetical protein